MTAQRKPAGRPVNVNLQAARLVGDKTYDGRTCTRCGGSERYTKGGACVHCMRAFAVESRQALKAARLNSEEAGDNLDFLTVIKPKRLRVSRGVTGRHTSTCDSQALDFLEDTSCHTSSQINSMKAEGIPESNTARNEKSCDDVCRKNLNPDPEPLCPDCGCGVEADHESIKGWLRRVSPWRCTICDWQDVNPPPSIDPAPPAIDVDTDDFLG